MLLDWLNMFSNVLLVLVKRKWFISYVSHYSGLIPHVVLVHVHVTSKIVTCT